VRALVNDLTVKLPSDSERSDEEIAHTAAMALSWNTLLPPNTIKIQVADGWITLEGTVEWHYQRMAAEQALKDLMGLKGITNKIMVQPTARSQQEKKQVALAFERDAWLFSYRINVRVVGDKIVLEGKVPSIASRIAAECSAWNTPGVHHVQNDLVVDAALASAKIA